VAEEKKLIVKQKKVTEEISDKEWKTDLQQYNEVILLAWQPIYQEVDSAWIPSKEPGRKRSGKKLTYSPRLKRPFKPKGPISRVAASEEASIGTNNFIEEGIDNKREIEAEQEEDQQDLVDSMRAFKIEHFVQVSPSKQWPSCFAILKLALVGYIGYGNRWLGEPS